MANWARGLASGLEAGYKFGEMVRQKQLRDEYQRVADANQQFQITQAEGDRLRELEAQGYSFEFDPVKRQYVATPPSGLTTGQRPEILGYTPALGGEGYDDRVARGLGMEPQPTGYSRAQAVPAPDIQEQYAGGVAPYRGVVLQEATGDGGESYAAGLAAPNRLRPVTYGGVPVDYSMDNRPTPTAASAYSGDLPVPAGTPESSGPLSIYRPEDSDIYKGLTRAMATPERIGPTSTTFLGREYAGGLTKAQEDVARMNAYADVMAANGDPAGAQRMRMVAVQEQRAQESHAMGLRKGTLELQDLEATAEKKKSLRDIQSSMSSWFKQRVGDRQPTADDYEAFDTKVISDLMAGGHVDEANAAFDRRNRVVMERIKTEGAARGQAINEAVFALSSGDLKPTVELYNRFVHDGAKVTNVVRNDKDGSVTVKRQAADGTDLPDYKFGSLDELSASLRSLTDSGAFAAYTQNTFMNNIRTKTLAVEERKAAADERRAGAYERRANAAENRAEREAVVYLTDGKQVYEYRRSSLPYDKSGRLQLPDGMSIYKGQGQVSQGNLTKEQETALRAIEGSEAFKSAYDTVNDPNTPAAEKRAAAARIEQMLKQRGLPPDLYKFEQYEHQPMP